MGTNHQQILGINTQFEFADYPGLDCKSFRDAISFFDYDAVIIDTQELINEYIGYGSYNSYQGNALISENMSPKIVADYNRVKEQICKYNDHGKNVFVIMSKSEDCFIHTGRSSISGTGKNACTTNSVDTFNVFSFLPVPIKPTILSGTKVNIECNQPYSSFFNTIKSFIYYEVVFNAPSEACLLTTPDKGKAISAVFKRGKGNLILLPYCDIQEEDDDDENGEKCNEKVKVYLDALLELNRSLLSNEEAYVLPQWANVVKMPGEDTAEAEIEKDKAKLIKLQEKIEKDEAHLSAIQSKKRLVSASGSVLEGIVKDVLKDIGFHLHRTEVGRSDIVASYNTIDVVAEIKGVSKSAAEKHAAQLEKWVSQFIEENDRRPKPILIVNGFCDTPLTERKEDVFPDQMIRYCVSREHALITTTQLLCLYIEIKNDPSCAETRIRELLGCVGRYSRYLDYEKYITIIEKTEA